MSKLLEDILGASSFGNLAIPSGIVRTTDISTCIPGRNATSIDFSGLGTSYLASSLLGYGFDSTCATCENHYSIVFIDGQLGESQLVQKNTGLSFGTHFTLAIPINDSITSGTQLCAYLLDEFCKAENSDFISHFQQYAYKDNTLYIFDNRDYQIGGFWTSIYKYVSKITATYVGPEIEVGNQYNIDDVRVTIEYTSYNDQIIVEDLDPREFTVSGLTVTQYGVNTFYAAYKGASDVRDDFIVPSLPREIFKITCEYIGPDIHIYSDYDVNDIEVTVYYKDTPAVPYVIPISQCIPDKTKVMQSGENQFRLTFDSTQLPHVTPQMTYSLLYIVDGIGIDDISATYTGPAIDLLHTHSTNDVEVSVVYQDGCTEVLQNQECTFETDTIVQKSPYDTFDVWWTDCQGNIWYTFYQVPSNGVYKVEVQYIGPPILIQDVYKYSDLAITAYLGNGSTISVPISDCVFEDPTIYDNGINKKYLIYTDAGGIKWTIFFDVPGIPRPILLQGEYLGLTKLTGDVVPQAEIKVTLTYLLNDTGLDNRNTEEVELSVSDWFFVGGSTITSSNNGCLTIGFEKNYGYTTIYLTALVPVDFLDIARASLIAWYEGPPIEVGQPYDISKVVVYLCEDGKDRLRLLYTDAGVIIEPGLIANTGDNWFCATYVRGPYTLTDQFPVKGIVYKVYEEAEFQVVYIVKDTRDEIDLTDEFRPYFEFNGAFCISWNQFLKRVYDYWLNGTPYFGMFRITAPKNTGLFAQYATSWHVYCRNEYTLKAEIYKIYSDEEKEESSNGKT